mmetsp:Transcript_34690/g.68897  ORF Transcript_34690/g.68897 Transcript_34690/m.68897 type:complete len:316 (+) Transcript_34690:47-994(+)
MSDEYEVLFDWEPENPDDLRLFAGETLEVLQKNDHGWWYGVADRSGTVHKGYFPKNYVKPVDIEPAVPTPPPRPTKSMPPPPTQQAEVSQLSDQVQKVAIARGPSFSLKTCTAFDDLMELGYATELDPTFPASKGEPISRGAQVEIKCKAEIWDGASTITKEFANGNITFVTGEKQVVAGLDAAVQKLVVGQKATITCSPSMAYGSAGCPPSVPPNSFVVFTIEVLSSGEKSVSGPNSSASAGTEILIASSGVVAPRKVNKGTENRRDSRIILVDNGASSPTKPAKPSAGTKPGGQPISPPDSASASAQNGTREV